MRELLLLIFPLLILAKTFTGKVVDTEQKGIAFATITVATTSCSTISDINGAFKLDCEKNLNGGMLTGAKNGYLIGATNLDNNQSFYKIVLEKVPQSDNPHYRWIDATDTKDARACRKCHEKLTKQWLESAHGSSAQNEAFKTIFDTLYRADFKHSKGNCASCHQPMGADKSIGCDFCHKIYRVTPKKNLTGILAVELRRPFGEKNIVFGSLKDAYTREDSYSPLYQSSQYCASCHSGHFWDEEVYSEYSEWQRSRYSKNGVTCQKCHMPSDMKERFIVPKEHGGLEREAGAFHSHLFKASKDRDFLKAALDVNVSLQRGETFDVSVTLENIGAGHEYPTGTPLHHLLLTLEPKDCNGNATRMLQGEYLPRWSMKEKKTGSIFAKVYRSSLAYTQNSAHFKPLYPNPYWRPSQLEYNSRLQPHKPILKKFIFEKKSAEVNIKVIYRRIFASWTNKEIDNDIILFEKALKGVPCE